MQSPIVRLYRKFPRNFWIVVGVHFIDKIGGTLAFPFFALYITRKFQVGMTQAGMLLGLLSFCGIIGSMVGGAFTDRLGRRKPILAGLVFSALSSLALGSIDQFAWLFPMAAFAGFMSDIGSPAHAAMVADILPQEQRQDGFGILRVASNMAWLVGPTVGGFVAKTSFFALFVIDATISCVVALLFLMLMPETWQRGTGAAHRESVFETFRNYPDVIRDKAFSAFLAACMLMGVVYIQMYNSLSVYLRDVHGIQAQGYGFLLTTSAITVILLQISVIGAIRARPQFLMMALGTAFYAVGFGMFAIISRYWLFMAAIVIITVGEMIVMPTSQALAAGFARIHMRGRYMAAFGLTQQVPAAIGPAAAGFVLDHLNPDLLWVFGSILCTIALAGFCALHVRLGSESRFVANVDRPQLLEA